MQSMLERIDQKADIYQKLLFVTSGGQVRRFHTVPTLKDINVGQHQYTVAWLCWLLWEDLCTPSVHLIMAALSHDNPEVVTCDISSPTKHMLGIGDTLNKLDKQLLGLNTGLFTLTPQEEATLKLADRMAGMLECVHERALGNRYIELSYGRFDSYIERDNLIQNNTHYNVLLAIKKLWQEATEA